MIEVEIKNLSKSFEDMVVLDKISLNITEAGKCSCIRKKRIRQKCFIKMYSKINGAGFRRYIN